MKPTLLLAARVFALGIILLATGPVGASDLDYPQLYRDLDLPEYAGATVTGLGRSNASLADGISVTLHSESSHGVLRSYYETAMADLGWALQETVAVTRLRESGMLDQFPFNAVFCSTGNVAFQVTTVDLGTVRELSISVTDGSNSCSP